MPAHQQLSFAICGALAVALIIPCAPRVAHADDARRDPSAIQICMLPLGKHNKRLMAHAANGIRYLYGFRVTTLPARKMPRRAYYKPRKRYRAEKLLDYIANRVVPEHECTAIVGFTALDISTTKGKIRDWGILGMAYVGGTAAVVSTYRVRRKASKRKQAKRTIKVMNHELGHVLGLDHYDDEAGCVMNDAKGTVKTVDKESGLLCAPSRAYIERTHRIALPDHQVFDWKRVLSM